MKIVSAIQVGIISTAMAGSASGAINYEYRGGWDNFPATTAPGKANELLHNTPSNSPFTLTDSQVNGSDLIVNNTHATSIDFHETVKTPLFETYQGRGQGFLYVMGLKDLTVRSGWQTLVSNEFTWANSTWSLAINTSKGLDQIAIQGFWENSAGSVSTYNLGTVDLSDYVNTTVAFGMQRQTAEGNRVGTFFYANGTNVMLNNSSLIAHNNGNPLGNAILGLGPSTEQSGNANQGYYGLDNAYVYNIWTDSTAINASSLEALTEQAHIRRGSIPEPTSSTLTLVCGMMILLRRNRLK